MTTTRSTRLSGNREVDELKRLIAEEFGPVRPNLTLVVPPQ
jgi:hypothetical protein